jgi:hypothetical protein
MSDAITESKTEGKNRFQNALRNPDFTIDQGWASYTDSISE